MRLFGRPPSSAWLLLMAAVALYAWSAVDAFGWNMAKFPRVGDVAIAIWAVLPATIALVVRPRLLAMVIGAVAYWQILAACILTDWLHFDFLGDLYGALYGPVERPFVAHNEIRRSMYRPATVYGADLAYALAAYGFSWAASVRLPWPRRMRE